MANLETRPYWSETVRQIEPGDKVIGGANAPINLCLANLADRTEWLKKELVEAIASIGENNQTAQENFTSITAELARKVKSHGALSSRNLNDLKGDANYGVWHQNTNAAATPERNYPTTKAGTLYVLPSAYSGQQIYYPLDQNVFYKRHSLPDESWSVWHTMCEVIDSPSSTSATAAASANQVKRLNDRAANIERTKLGNTGNQTISNGGLIVGDPTVWFKTTYPSGNGRWVFETDPAGSANTPNSIRFNYKFEEDGKPVKYLSFPDIGSGQTVAYQSWVNSRTITAGNGLTGGGDLSANRTFSLGTPSQITADSTNAVTATSHTHAIDKASTAVAGIVQLNSATNSDAENLAATPKAVKAAFDRAAQSAPSGVVAFFAGANAPVGWLKANGAAVSRTTYAALFAAIGTTFGAGDGSTTFKLPDLRGEFIRSWDDGRGVDNGRSLGSAQANDLARHSHLAPTASSDWATAPATSSAADNFYEVPSFEVLSSNSNIRVRGYDYLNDEYGHPSAPVSETGGTETRPRNVALLACIKV